MTWLGYIPSTPSRACFVFVLTVVLCAPIPAYGADAEENAWTAESVLQQRESVQAEIAAIPADAAEGSLEARKKASLQRRAALFDEYLGYLDRTKNASGEQGTLEERAAAARKRLTSEPPEAALPDIPTREQFDELAAELTQERAGVESLRSSLADLRNRLEQAPQLQADARKRAQEAAASASQLADQLAASTDASEKAQLELRQDNALLEQRVAEQADEALAVQLALADKLEPVLADELEAAEKELQQREDLFARYSGALEERLALESAELEGNLQEKQVAAAGARSPGERLVAEAEAAIAESQKNIGELQSTLVTLGRDAAEQEKRLAAEKAELENVRDFLRRSDDWSQAADRIKLLLNQLRQRRKLLTRVAELGLADELNTYRARRFTIDNTLLDLRDRWDEDQEAALLSLPETARDRFVARAGALATDYRGVLREEKSLLTDAITVGQQMQDLILARQTTLNEAERFLRSRAFWLRDGKPLGPEAVRPLPREWASLMTWAVRLGRGEAVAALRAWVGTLPALFNALAALVFLPALLLYVRRRLRRFVRRRNERAARAGDGLAYGLWISLAAVVSAALLPLYLAAIAQLLSFTGVPQSLGNIISEVLRGVALALFVWLLTRAFLSENGIGPVQLGVHTTIAKPLKRVLRFLSLAYLLLLVPWRILLAAPFELQALPRLAYTLFEIAAVVAAVYIAWGRQPLLRRLLLRMPRARVAQFWPLLRAGMVLMPLLILILDVMGFRYAASSLSWSLGLSLLTVLLLSFLYQILSATIRSFAERQEEQAVEMEEPAAVATAAPELAPQVERAARVVLMLVGLVLLAGIWGLDDQAFQTLDEISIYEVRSDGEMQEYVSAADLLRFVLYIAGMLWILRHLPGIYEFAVFPRLALDEGAKYAVLTISRYGVFIIGVVLALSEIHLNLDRIGWLVAAIGVGLGFGLQEIVSNFVSGIILLVERPIRVNDLVTVGEVSGVVRRINIRATTIVNFDLQEVVLPNRNLITQEVTNWTRGDTVNRLVIDIGVAYGSDVGEVSRLLYQIAREDPDVLDDPAPSVVFMQHGDSSLDFTMRVFIPTPELLFVIRDRLNTAINREFARRGIEIPFPQRDIHIRSGVATTLTGDGPSSARKTAAEPSSPQEKT